MIEKVLTNAFVRQMEISRYSHSSIKTYKSTITTFFTDFYPTKAKDITKERIEKLSKFII